MLEQMLTQRQLAARSGVSQSQLSRYFQGTRALSVVELYDLCDALGLNISGVVADALRHIDR
jgi:transcriptional regulator with XRE-family HTH domain